jgi:hypothetical protein
MQVPQLAVHALVPLMDANPAQTARFALPAPSVSISTVILALPVLVNA